MVKTHVGWHNAALLLLVSTAVGCCGQQHPGPLTATPYRPVTTATPNRPTVTNTAKTTQFGVLEVEFGISAARQRKPPLASLDTSSR